MRPSLHSYAGPLAVGAVLAGAGLLFAVSASTASGTQLRADRADLPGLIRAEAARVETRAQRVDSLRTEIDDATRKLSSTDSTLARLQAQIATAAPSAGLAPVRGQALRVTLNDAPRNVPVPAQARPDDLVVHQQDVQAVVNAMWAGGAEAMMLQDQRVISTSAVRCVGNTLILQGRVYSPPYVITAIGDIDAMEEAIGESTEISIYQQYVEAYGLGWKAEEAGELTFPAYSGSLDLQYATSPQPSPAPSGDGAQTSPPAAAPSRTDEQ